MRSKLRFLLIPLIFTASLFAEPLALGAELPKVSCKDQNGNLVTLTDYSAEPWLLVYFYPKANTSGCTKQACSLRDSYADLEKANVKVIGVSKDKVKSQKSFTDKHKLPFTLLADLDTKVIQSFGVSQIPGIGLAKRQAFLFKQGKLEWRDLKASTKQQAADVLEQISK